jgi:pSer/pThr/pTyr-binding forkhead associated (FHA) protein
VSLSLRDLGCSAGHSGSRYARQKPRGGSMTRPDDEFPPLDVTSTLNLGAIEDAIEGSDADVVPTRVSGSLPPGTALLAVRRGPNAGARFLLDHDVTTSGRHPDSDIFLDDVTVSRRHAEFHREGGTFTVRDVGSLNGTYVNRERVEAATLSNGDEVQIGKFRLVFVAGPRPDES